MNSFSPPRHIVNGWVESFPHHIQVFFVENVQNGDVDSDAYRFCANPSRSFRSEGDRNRSIDVPEEIKFRRREEKVNDKIAYPPGEPLNAMMYSLLLRK